MATSALHQGRAIPLFVETDFSSFATTDKGMLKAVLPEIQILGIIWKEPNMDHDS